MHKTTEILGGNLFESAFIDDDTNSFIVSMAGNLLKFNALTL